MSSLLTSLRRYPQSAIAFSGGVDSSVLAKAMVLVHGPNTIAVMAVSPSTTVQEVERAKRVANEIGIAIHILPGRELDDPDFVKNDSKRCYYCKRIRFGDIISFATQHGYNTVLDGTNADDSMDYRPGKIAAEELGVRSPLAEMSFTKPMIRTLAKEWNLSNWNDSPQPCLSTRIARGIPITESLLRKIEAAEDVLRTYGFSTFRVRVHPSVVMNLATDTADTDSLVTEEEPINGGEEWMARIEVLPDEMEKLMMLPLRTEIGSQLLQLGFSHVTCDLFAFRSGSMNGRKLETK